MFRSCMKYLQCIQSKQVNINATDLKLVEKGKRLNVSFDNGKNYSLPSEYLRVESPSAEVQGHHPSQKKLISGRKYVRIIGIEMVGNYAVRLVFDDLHESGIYSWSTLYKLGEKKYSTMKLYLSNLKKMGKSRDPRASSSPTSK